MRNNLFSWRSLLLAAPLFLVSVLPLKAIPWSAEVQQESIQEQFKMNPISSNVFEGSFGVNGINSTSFAPEVDCLNTSSYGSAVAPTDHLPKTISTCNFGGEYATITGAAIGSSYSLASSIVTDYLTIRQGTYDGPILAQGITPVSVSITVAGNLFVHINSDANCGAASGCRETTITCMTCLPPPSCTTPIISTYPFTETFENNSPARQCWTNEIVSGSTNWVYRTGAFSGTVTTAHGGTLNAAFTVSNYNGHTTRLVSPKFDLTDKENATLSFWYANEAWTGDQNELRVYYKVGAGAWTLIPGAEFTSNVSAWTLATFNLPASDGVSEYTIAFEGVGDWARGVVVDDVVVDAEDATNGPTGCQNTSKYPSGTVSAPTNEAPKTVSTCNYASEYFEISAVVSGSQYSFGSSVATDFYTIREGSVGGPVLAVGVAPLVYTATSTTNLFVHINADSSCATQSSCRTTTITCVSCTPIVIEEPNFDCFQGDGITTSFDDGNGIKATDIYRVADDFTVDPGIEFTMRQVTIDVLSSTAITTATINVRANNAGSPGAILQTVTMAPSASVSYTEAFGFPIRHLTFDLATPLVFTEGTYWLEPTMMNTNSSTPYWLVTSAGSHGAVLQNSGDSGANWSPNLDDYQAVFFVAGDCDAVTGGCGAVNVPYYQDFESAIVPAMPDCTSIENAGAGNNWVTFSGSSYGFTGKFLRYSWNTNNPANTWFYTQGVNLTAGTEYQITYDYGSSGTAFPEKLKVAYGTSAASGSMTTVLADHPNVVNNTPITNVVTFTPTATDVYYFGFNAYSTANQFYLHVDNIKVELADNGGVIIEEPDFDCFQGDGITSSFDNGYSIKTSSTNRVADDFTVDPGIDFTMRQVTVDVLSTTAITTATINVRADNAGAPGAVIETVTMAPSDVNTYATAFNFPIHHLTFDLATPLVFTEGTYWLEANMENTDNSNVFWLVTSTGTHGAIVQRSTTTGTTWMEDVDGLRAVFFVAGDCDVQGGGGSECLTTLFASNNGGSPGWAQLFDVTVKGSDLSINNIAVNTSVTSGSVNLEVYLIENGTYVGNENNPSAWGTPISTGSGTAMGDNNPTTIDLNTPISLDANTDYAFAIVLDQSPRYTNGTGSNQFYENDELEINLGSAVGGLFTGTVFANRIFNGTLCYDIDGGGGQPGGACDIDYEISLDDGTGNTQTLLFADDFLIDSGTTMTVDQVTLRLINNVGMVSKLAFHADAGGQPAATALSTFTNITPDSQTVVGTNFGFNFYDVVLSLPTDVEFEGGMYWVVFQTTAGTDGGTGYWAITNDGVGAPGKYSTDAGVTWTTNSSNYDFSFKLDGVCDTGGGTPGLDCDQGDDSNGFENGYNISAGGTFRNADDFVVSVGNTLNVKQIELNVFANEPMSTMNFNFYSDNGGSPSATIVEALTNVPVEAVAIGTNFGYTVYAVFAEVDIDFTEGTYWMQPIASVSPAFWEVTSIGTLGAYIHTSESNGPWVSDPDQFQGVFKLHCEAVDPPEEECLLSFSFVEAITRVKVADIDNVSPANSTIELEDFTSIEGNVETGESYPIALEGNTSGNYTNYFTVWVDWNQNGTYETSEMYEIGSITNSTGTDGQQATGTIAVPTGAAIGSTTMRVIKNYANSPINPCGSYSFGQAEDYTIIVTEGTGGNTGFTCEDQTVPSGGFTNGYFLSNQLAVDIIVGDNGFDVYGVELNVLLQGSSDRYFDFTFHDDASGLPGGVAFGATGIVQDSDLVGSAFGYDVYTYTVAFDVPVSLAANTTYWMQVESDADAWESTDAVTFGSHLAVNTGSGWEIDDEEFVYTLICEELGVSNMTSFDFAYYPNPVKEVLNINSQKAVKSVEAFNLTGQKVLANAKVLNGQLNVSALTTGTYVFRVTLEDGQVETFKIIKK